MNNDQRIAEITARCEAATPGPWYAKENWLIGGFSITTKDAYPHDERVPEIATMASKENAEFIAHSRSDIPYLLSEVKRLTAENERLREAISKYCHNDCYRDSCEGNEGVGIPDCALAKYIFPTEPPEEGE